MKTSHFLFLILIPILSFSQSSSNAYYAMLKTLYKNSVKTISVNDLQKEIGQKDKPVLLDARASKEYNVCHITGGRWVGYEDFSLNKVKNIPKNSPIVVYCSVGYRSERIGEQLQKAGYTNVRNLYGGIFEWINAGYNVFDNQQNITTKVHGYSTSWGIWVKKGEVVYP